MNAIVNGTATELRPALTVAELLVDLGHDPRGRGIAVALNGEVLPKAVWGATPVRENDRVEVLVATQGG